MFSQNEKKQNQYQQTIIKSTFFQERKIVNFAEKIIYPKLNRTNVLLNSCCCRSVPNVSYIHATTTALCSRMGGGLLQKAKFSFFWCQKYGIGSLFMVRLKGWFAFNTCYNYIKVFLMVITMILVTHNEDGG